jgi:hypothetical protein
MHLTGFHLAVFWYEPCEGIFIRVAGADRMNVKWISKNNKVLIRRISDR